ncbi:MAG: hypothetical protein K0R84_2047 [Clostridia bacterium]|jgi:predicted secreted protein|nr:hypothetical protein [Clostridia bacterium]
MREYLCSRKIWVRFLVLYAIGVALFIAAWIISFNFLPEGAMRGSNAASKLAGDGASASVVKEFARIFIVNLVMSCFIVGGNYVLKINNIPLGYIVPPVWFITYGLTLGSNSFAISLPERIGPSLMVFQRSGIYELAAYTLIAAATYNISRYQIKKFFKTNPEKVEARIYVSLQQYLGIAAAVLILAVSNYMEALMIFNR